MKLIRNHSTDPARNLALEEYVQTSLQGDFVLFWRNRESVILGKNQNALWELDMDFVERERIEVVRRNSGGGAVFHDLGNINFTFVEDYSKEAFHNYEKFTRPIVDYLATWGVTAALSGRNDLLLTDPRTGEQAKVSGNAQAVRQGRLLHHGTLLYSAHMGKLVGALRPRPMKYSGRGVKSVEARVTNICSLFSEMPPVERFLEELITFFAEQGEELTLSPHQWAEVTALAERKYRNRDWNFGRAPRFGLEKSKKYPFGLVEVGFTVQGGILEKVHLFGDFFGVKDCRELEEFLQGQPFEKKALAACLEDFPLEDYIVGMEGAMLVDLLWE